MDEDKRIEASERMKQRWAEKKALNNNEPETVQEIPANLTPEEMAIARRVASEDRSWETLIEGEVNDYSLSADPFALPEPAQKLRDSKEFAFRWITRDPKRIDEVKNKRRPMQWWIVTRTNPRSRIFDKEIDPICGGIIREDQILVFKPFWLFEEELNVKRGLADGMHQSKNIDNIAKENAGAELLGAKSVSKSRLSVNGGDIQYSGEAEADAGSVTATE